MAWIELHQSVWTHKKTLLLAAELDMSETHAVAHLIRLWTWALDNAPTGDLSGLPPKVIAIGAGWDKDPEVFVRAAINAGWFDKTDEGLFIHDWYDYAGKLMERRKANAERMRRARAEAATNECNARATHVQNTTSARAGATVPNRTVPNHTKPENNNLLTCASPDDDARAGNGQSPAVNNPVDDVEAVKVTVQPDEQSTNEAGQDPGGSVEAEKVTATLEDKPSKSGPRSPFKSKRQEQLFDLFWEQYPKRRSKGRAERAWVKIKPDEQLFEAIMAGLERAKTSVEWQKDGGQYIPYPSSWLNAKGWEDEYTATEVNANAEHWRHTPEPPAFGSTAQAKNRFAGLARDGGTGRIAGGQDGPLGGGNGPSARDTGEGASSNENHNIAQGMPMAR